MIHTSFYTGAKIRIIFHDGSQLITKYLGRRKGQKLITGEGYINVIDIRAVSYYKPFKHERS